MTETTNRAWTDDLHRKRAVNMLGKTCDHLRVVAQDSERAAFWRCECLYPVDGKPCGRQTCVRGKDLRNGRSKSCGHHSPGRITKELIKQHPYVGRIFEENEWWILPSKAGRLLGIKRLRKEREHTWADEHGIRRRAIVTGLGSAVLYVAERDVNDQLQRKSARLKIPKIPGHIYIGEAEKLLKLSHARIGEIAREHRLPDGMTPPNGSRLVRFDGKDKKGRACKRTYLSAEFFDWLKLSYLASAEKVPGRSKHRFAAPKRRKVDQSPPAADAPSRDGASSRDAAGERPGEQIPALNVRKPNMQRKKGGRPKGSTDPDVQERRAEMIERWKKGDFGESYKAAGDAYGMDKSVARKIILGLPLGKTVVKNGGKKPPVKSS